MNRQRRQEGKVKNGILQGRSYLEFAKCQKVDVFDNEEIKGDEA